MAVYVDELVWQVDIRGQVSNPGWARQSLWCHMMTDGGIEELHQMADKIGLKREWFQNHPLHPHYDLRPSMRKLAVENGAVEVTKQELVKRCSKFFRPDED